MIAGVNRIFVTHNKSIINKGFVVNDNRIAIDANWVEIEFSRDSAQYACNHKISKQGDVFEHSLKFMKQTASSEDYAYYNRFIKKHYAIALYLNSGEWVIAGVNISMRCNLSYTTGNNPAESKGIQIEMSCLCRENVEYVSKDLIIKQLITPIKFGLLYNWYAVSDIRNIANTGWRVPTKEDLESLIIYLGGYKTLDLGWRVVYSGIGNSLKEDNSNYWEEVFGTNQHKFNARGSGYIVEGEQFMFGSLKYIFSVWTSTVDGDQPFSVGLYYDSNDIVLDYNCGLKPKNQGMALRLCRNSNETNNFEGNYTGNDKKRYKTICIGGLEFTADNLAETKYRNGDSISEVTDLTEWAALTTGAMCAYDNDPNNI